MDAEIINEWLTTAKAAAIHAGDAIMKVYSTADLGIEQKVDKSPLTLADKASHESIVQGLHTSGLPVLSEEGTSIAYESRSAWQYYWLIDPLDGTKEFIKRNGEFTVNIALIHNGFPVFGVVYVPDLQTMYWGGRGLGSFKQKENEHPLQLPLHIEEGITTIVASRSHMSTDTQTFIEQYPGVNMISMGSSLKFLLVAEGKAQLYPRFAPTMEWDTAAAHAVVEGAGGEVVWYPSNEGVTYNRKDMLNGWFLVKNLKNKQVQ